MRAPYETRHEAGENIAAHRHEHAYAALVLAGRYEEAGPDGVWACEAGEVIVHPPFHLHLNRFGFGDARVLNFTLPHDLALALGVADYAVIRVGDPGRVARCAHTQDALREALIGAEERMRPAPADWLDELAVRLADDPRHRIGALARLAGVTPEHATRAFTRRFGLRPAAFRAEQRLRRALRQLPRAGALAEIAVASGFADQAHFTRALRGATGESPLRLRARLS